MPSSLNRETTAIAGLYLSKNYAIVFCNYPGFGRDDTSQPYLIFPRVNICSLFTLLQDNAFTDIIDKVENGRSIYSVGYS
jgi:hypothetical protein